VDRFLFNSSVTLPFLWSNQCETLSNLICALYYIWREHPSCTCYSASSEKR
jgi:hypothetical protein